MAETLAAQVAQGHHVNPQLLQLEMLRAIQTLSRKDHDSGSENDEQAGDPSWGSDKDSRKLAGIRRLRRRWERHPEAMIREFVGLCRERIGVSSSHQAWHLKQYSSVLHPQFQKHAGLYRIHYALMEMLNLMVLTGDIRKGLALAVQLAKAVHQAALDGGVWSTAKLLLPYEDPLVPTLWAGTYGELAATASYKEGVAIVHAAAPNRTSGPREETAGEPGPAAGARNAQRSSRAKAKAAAAEKKKKEEQASAGVER